MGRSPNDRQRQPSLKFSRGRIRNKGISFQLTCHSRPSNKYRWHTTDGRLLSASFLVVSSPLPFLSSTISFLSFSLFLSLSFLCFHFASPDNNAPTLINLPHHPFLPFSLSRSIKRTTSLALSHLLLFLSVFLCFSRFSRLALMHATSLSYVVSCI